MTKLLMSHNDEWTKHPIDDAIIWGCDILEVDVVYSHGEIWAAHSKRWFKFLYRMTLEKYLSRFPKKRILYLDLKTANPDAIVSLYFLIIRFKLKDTTILIGGSGDRERENIARTLRYRLTEYGCTSVFLFSNFAVLHKIESVDVFGKRRWWMK